MEQTLQIRKHIFFLFFSSVILNLFFFYATYNNHNYFSGYRVVLGELAFNVYAHNSTKVNLERYNAAYNYFIEHKKVPEYYEIDHARYQEGTSYPQVDVTPWYSCILGLLWKVTHSLSYKDIIFLQILFFSLSLILIYHTAFLLFQCSMYALNVGIFTLLFFPLVFHNVVVLRDIWPFYGTVSLFYGIVSYLYSQKLKKTFLSGIIFALCQLIRPPMFTTLCSVTFVLLVCFWFELVKVKIKPLLAALILTNVIVFWIPFMGYNYLAYGRLFISPIGQNLLEGLGEFQNRWGYQISDRWFFEYMKDNFNLEAGSPSCDDKAKQLFFNAINEDPKFYITSLFRRMHKILLPALSWFPWAYNDSAYDRLESVSARFNYIMRHCCHSWYLIDLIARHCFVRLYILLGYLGLLLMVIHRRYLLAFLLLSILCSSWVVILSHVEYRYIVYTFAFLPYCIAYLVMSVFKNKFVRGYTMRVASEST